MFEASFNATMDRFRNLLKDVGEDRLRLLNDNFDVGEATGPGEYRMNDDAHAELLEKLAEKNFADMPPGLRAELLAFYADPNAPYATKRKPKEWSKVEANLQKLRNLPPEPETAQAMPVSTEPFSLQILGSRVRA
jgi:hypothetical protein